MVYKKNVWSKRKRSPYFRPKKVSTDDYSLSLVDMAYDGNIGRILIKLEALTKEAEKRTEAAAKVRLPQKRQACVIILICQMKKKLITGWT